MPYRIDPKTGRKVFIDASGQPMQQPQTNAGSQQTNKNTQQSNAVPEEEQGGFVMRFVRSLTEPFKMTARQVGEAVNVVSTPGMVKSALGGKLSDEELKSVSEYKPKFLKEEQVKDRGSILKTTAKTAAGVGSFAIPFGKGAGIVSKAILPGAVSGAMFKASEEDADIDSIIESAAYGGIGAGLLHGAGSVISKGGKAVGFGKKAAATLDDTAKGLQEGTRQIKQKGSIYGASKEKAINATLNKYGFKGSAQKQYEMLEPAVTKIEGNIKSVIAKNPAVTVAKNDIKKSFLLNLKSSLRSKDLTEKQALVEIDGYLKDLIKASGGKGKFTSIDLETLRSLKKLVNEDYGPVVKVLENNGSLTPRQKVIEAAWESLDDAVKGASPELKSLLTDESNLYKAAQSLSSARSNPPTLRIAGTSAPGFVTQAGRDIASGTLSFAGKGIDKVTKAVESALSQIPEATPEIAAAIGARLPQLLQANEGAESDVIPPLKESAGTTGGEKSTATVDSTPATPTPLSPFGNLTKRQVLALAMSEGASAKDLQDLSTMYDLVADETGSIGEETMKVADSLRTEYFKRTNENGFLDVSNSFKKISNTPDTAAGDVSIIFSYMKMLDPASVVREGEFATAEQTAGIPDQIVKLYNKALSGKRLSGRQKDAFIEAATSVYDQYKTSQDQIDGLYQNLSKRYGIDPALVGIGIYNQ